MTEEFEGATLIPLAEGRNPSVLPGYQMTRDYFLFLVSFHL